MSQNEFLECLEQPDELWGKLTVADRELFKGK